MPKHKPSIQLTKLQILSLLLLPFVAAGLFYVFGKKTHSRVVAADALVVTYNGVSLVGPIFNVDNMLPGDCEEREVVVKNVSETSFNLGVKATNVNATPAGFPEVLDLMIKEGSVVLHDQNPLKMFFDTGPTGINLLSINANETKTLNFSVCFQTNAENEYQNANTIFDLVFFTAMPPIELPEECSQLEGIITHRIEGTPGNDRIDGTPKSELIVVYGGNDRVYGGPGDDCIVGGEGNDRLYGDSGNDIIVGGGGDDRIDSGQGNDKVFDLSGNNKVDTGSNDDYVLLGSGKDEADLGSGNDICYLGAGNDKAKGGSGDDTIHGGDGNDELHGGSGKDRLYGENGNDKMYGDSNDDLLDGGTQSDKLYGNSGQDTCLNGETLSSCEI